MAGISDCTRIGRLAGGDPVAGITDPGLVLEAVVDPGLGIGNDQGVDR